MVGRHHNVRAHPAVVRAHTHPHLERMHQTSESLESRGRRSRLTESRESIGQGYSSPNPRHPKLAPVGPLLHFIRLSSRGLAEDLLRICVGFV